jgi:GTP-binding protein HflX
VSADLLLLLCDAADPECDGKLAASMELLKELGAEHKPVITVYNKCDIAPGAYLMPAEKNAVRISAANGVGLDRLLRMIAELLPDPVATVRLRLPYSETALAAWLHENAAVLSEDFREDGIYISATVKKSALKRFLPFIWNE